MFYQIKHKLFLLKSESKLFKEKKIQYCLTQNRILRLLVVGKDKKSRSLGLLLTRGAVPRIRLDEHRLKYQNNISLFRPLHLMVPRYAALRLYNLKLPVHYHV